MKSHPLSESINLAKIVSIAISKNLASSMAEIQKKCNFEVEMPHCNGIKDGNTNTATKMKLSCELIAFLVSLNTILALIGIILGSLAIT